MVPQTGNYMIAGYVVILGGIFGYVASLWLRCRRARQEKQLLEESEPAA